MDVIILCLIMVSGSERNTPRSLVVRSHGRLPFQRGDSWLLSLLAYPGRVQTI